MQCGEAPAGGESAGGEPAAGEPALPSPREAETAAGKPRVTA